MSPFLIQSVGFFCGTPGLSSRPQRVISDTGWWKAWREAVPLRRGGGHHLSRKHLLEARCLHHSARDVRWRIPRTRETGSLILPCGLPATTCSEGEGVIITGTVGKAKIKNSAQSAPAFSESLPGCPSCFIPPPSLQGSAQFANPPALLKGKRVLHGSRMPGGESPPPPPAAAPLTMLCVQGTLEMGGGKEREGPPSSTPAAGSVF